MRAARPDIAVDPALNDPEPPLWERSVALLIVCMMTGALIGPVFAPTQEETPVLRLVWLPVYAAVAGLMLWRFERIVRAWPALLALLSLVSLAYASKYWSIDPEVTGRRVIAMAIMGCFAVYLGAVFRGPHLPRLLTRAALLMGLGSLVMVFAFPAIGIHQTDNAGLWRGLWYEKNQMGVVMVIGAVAASAWLASGDPRRLVPGLTLALTVALTLATQSKTSLLCLMLGCGLVAGLWSLRRGGPVFAVTMVWLGVVVAGAGLMLWLTDPASILVALGKDPSLTGRTDIWASLMRRVADRPWTGFGYSAFWGRESIPAEEVRMETGWLVPSAHNGWIDLLVQLGWPGAILVGTMMVSAAVLTALRLGAAGAREGGWALGYLAAFALLSLSESILMTHQSLPWALFLAILTRATLPERISPTVPLARERRGAYQTAPRIVPDYRHGSVRRPVPVR